MRVGETRVFRVKACTACAAMASYTGCTGQEQRVYIADPVLLLNRLGTHATGKRAIPLWASGEAMSFEGAQLILS